MDKIVTKALEENKTKLDKVALALLCGLTGLAATVLTEKGYFNGKAHYLIWRQSKTNN
jgi:hypothetical protein